MTTNGALNDAIARYVVIRDEIRDKKAESAAALKPLQAKLDALAGLLDKYFQTTGLKNIGAESGTAYLYVKPSASLADPKAFMDYVIQSERYDLLDKRANVTGVIAFTKEKGGLPPGVNLNMNRKVGVRRPGEKGDNNDE